MGSIFSPMPSSRLPQRQLHPGNLQPGDQQPGDLQPGDLPPETEHEAARPPQGQSSRARPDLIDVLITVACFLAAGLTVGILASTLGVDRVAPEVRAVLMPIVLAGQSLAFLIAFLWIVWHGRRLSLRQLGLGTLPPAWLKRGALWGAGAILPAILVNAITLVLIGAEETNPQVALLAPAGPSLWGFLVILPLVSILVPFVEELAFRGVLYGWLRQQLPQGLAILISAVIFAVAHGIPQLMPALILVGVLLARLRELEDSLWPCIAMHGVFNAVMTLVLFAALSAGVEPTQSL